MKDDNPYYVTSGTFYRNGRLRMFGRKIATKQPFLDFSIPDGDFDGMLLVWPNNLNEGVLYNPGDGVLEWRRVTGGTGSTIVQRYLGITQATYRGLEIVIPMKNQIASIVFRGKNIINNVQLSCGLDTDSNEIFSQIYIPGIIDYEIGSKSNVDVVVFKTLSFTEDINIWLNTTGTDDFFDTSAEIDMYIILNDLT